MRRPPTVKSRGFSLIELMDEVVLVSGVPFNTFNDADCDQ